MRIHTVHNDYWVPTWKWQLVDWFFAYYKGKYPKSVFEKKKKSELYGWYFSARNNKKDVLHAA